MGAPNSRPVCGGGFRRGEWSDISVSPFRPAGRRTIQASGLCYPSDGAGSGGPDGKRSGGGGRSLQGLAQLTRRVPQSGDADGDGG